jgi:aminotransferase
MPGALFGDDTDVYTRISLLQPLDRIKEASERMKTFIAKIKVPA